MKSPKQTQNDPIDQSTQPEHTRRLNNLIAYDGRDELRLCEELMLLCLDLGRANAGS